MDTIILIFAVSAFLAAVFCCVLALRALRRLKRLEARQEKEQSAVIDAVKQSHAELKGDLAKQKHMLGEGLSSLNENFARSVIHSSVNHNG